MWKFYRGKSQQHSAERQKLQKELFSFCKTVHHGFPNKPTALAWDPELRIAAVGTATGAIKVFGRCGVEFYGQHSVHDSMILRLLFVPNEGKLISLCDNNSLHLWRINDLGIEEIESFVMEGKVKKVSALHVDETNTNLLIGTEGGNVYSADLETFSLSENIIYQDEAMRNVPDGKKVNPGAVEAIAAQPGNPHNVLIGYRRGLMILWNKQSSTSVQTYVNNQQLEYFCWDSDGKKFLSSHNDGSYVFWSTESSEPVEEPITVYGPFPCKAITKIEWCKSIEDTGDNLIVFSGGMPRASYSDRNTVTIQQGSKHVVLDFTSKVIDFFVTYAVDSDDCESLIVLLEEELVAVDLTNSEWRTIPLPYLISLHSSAVTVLTYVDDVSEDVWNTLLSIGKKQTQESYSSLEWPINGGVLKKAGDCDKGVRRDLLITGHEDGSVRFWNAGSVVLSLVYTFKTNSIFVADDDPLDEPAEENAEDEEEEWPPFKKVGCFDPFSDDPRLAIKKISLCPKSGTLIIAGTAGQIVVLKLNEDAVTDRRITVSTINIIPEKDNPDEVTYLWKGPKRLGLKGKTEEKNKITLSSPAGYQPFSIVQILPPAAVTAIALSASWSLVAVGTAHGLALYDFKAETPVFHRCTLNSNDYSSLSETPISRTKSFKKSLRESFRRIRGRSSVRHHDKHRSSKSSQSPVTPTDRKRGGRPSDNISSNSPISPLDARPVERAIEARPTDDAMGSMVKCVHFFNTNVVHAHHAIPSLWAGTNNGTVYIFTINVSGGAKRKNERTTAQLGKEIQLRHRAPVVSIAAINLGHKLLYVDDNPGPPGSHYVTICSEEQIKIFSLPNLKPVGKLKLTALEGARVRRVALGQFSSGSHIETCLMCLTNLGECIILSIPDLRRQETAAIIKREDINGISSFSFTKYGEGLYLRSSSEIQRISLSTSRKTIPRCSLSLSHSTKAPVEASPIKAEKHDHFINGIPEEDEEVDDDHDDVDQDEDEEEHESEDSLTKKGSSGDHTKKPLSDEENSVIFNPDLSVITMDSVKDHLS